MTTIRYLVLFITKTTHGFTILIVNLFYTKLKVTAIVSQAKKEARSIGLSVLLPNNTFYQINWHTLFNIKSKIMLETGFQHNDNFTHLIATIINRFWNGEINHWRRNAFNRQQIVNDQLQKLFFSPFNFLSLSVAFCSLSSIEAIKMSCYIRLNVQEANKHLWSASWMLSV